MTERTILPTASAANDPYHTAPFTAAGRYPTIYLPPLIIQAPWFWAGPARLSA